MTDDEDSKLPIHDLDTLLSSQEPSWWERMTDQEHTHSNVDALLFAAFSFAGGYALHFLVRVAWS